MNSGASNKRRRWRKMKFKIVKFGRRLVTAHVDPNNASRFFRRVTCHRNRFSKSSTPLLRLGRRIDYFATDVKFPTMENTTQSITFVSG
ncbi:hypothetical protein [Limnohabitans sp. Rim8]|uniref:hypothetical protein n=1 Tax=Limnohabitans sp. Rim8 TaxID=1100718 RepID=UPI003305D086